MSISKGSATIGSLYLGSTKIASAYLGNVKVYESTPVDPYNPLGLPAYTVRVRLAEGESIRDTYGTQVSASPNVWDVHKESASWEDFFRPGYGIIPNNKSRIIEEVLGANLSGVTSAFGMFCQCEGLTNVAVMDTRSVTNMCNMFYVCGALTTVALFPTGSVTDMSYMFQQCSSLKSIPLFDTSSATNVRNMFLSCTKVESGALAIYNQMSSQTTPPSEHRYTFLNCGADTASGAAELALIPSDWGGTGA